eukprot:scpid103611/ scgid23374/ 
MQIAGHRPSSFLECWIMDNVHAIPSPRSRSITSLNRARVGAVFEVQQTCSPFVTRTNGRVDSWCHCPLNGVSERSSRIVVQRGHRRDDYVQHNKMIFRVVTCVVTYMHLASQ